jgi:N-acetylglucosaminyl-diphospho-decaprenol L-rhamnosyltransferase
MSLESVSVCIPSFNGREALEATLIHLEREAADCQVIVVDSGNDGSFELVVTRFPRVKLTRIPNHGLAHGYNRAVELASGDVIVMLNSDVLIGRATLEACVAELQRNPGAGMVQPLALARDGRRQHSFGPLYPLNWRNVDVPTRANILHGYCLATTRSVLRRVGGLDERFFLYNEEIDLSWRIRNAGYALMVLPQTAIHFGGASTARGPNLTLEGARGGLWLVKRHFAAPIYQATRRLFQLIAWLMSSFDPRGVYREMWSTLEALCREEALLESPFPLSGRGIPDVVPNPETS